MEHLLNDQQPTAVFASNDLIALGAIDAIKRWGLRIPEDISIIGCDDIGYASMSTPKLSTMRLPSYEMGVEAMEMLQGKISGESTAIKHVYLDYSFVERETTRPVVSPKQIQIAVVGSLNMDYSTKLSRRPSSGDEVFHTRIALPHGKRQQQADEGQRPEGVLQLRADLAAQQIVQRDQDGQ